MSNLITEGIYLKPDAVMLYGSVEPSQDDRAISAAESSVYIENMSTVWQKVNNVWVIYSDYHVDAQSIDTLTTTINTEVLISEGADNVLLTGMPSRKPTALSLYSDVPYIKPLKPTFKLKATIYRGVYGFETAIQGGIATQGDLINITAYASGLFDGYVDDTNTKRLDTYGLGIDYTVSGVTASELLEPLTGYKFISGDIPRPSPITGTFRFGEPRYVTAEGTFPEIGVPASDYLFFHTYEGNNISEDRVLVFSLNGFDDSISVPITGTSVKVPYKVEINAHYAYSAVGINAAPGYRSIFEGDTLVTTLIATDPIPDGTVVDYIIGGGSVTSDNLDMTYLTPISTPHVDPQGNPNFITEFKGQLVFSNNIATSAILTKVTPDFGLNASLTKNFPENNFIKSTYCYVTVPEYPVAFVALAGTLVKSITRTQNDGTSYTGDTSVATELDSVYFRISVDSNWPTDAPLTYKITGIPSEAISVKLTDSLKYYTDTNGAFFMLHFSTAICKTAVLNISVPPVGPSLNLTINGTL